MDNVNTSAKDQPPAIKEKVYNVKNFTGLELIKLACNLFSFKPGKSIFKLYKSMLKVMESKNQYIYQLKIGKQRVIFIAAPDVTKNLAAKYEGKEYRLSRRISVLNNDTILTRELEAWKQEKKLIHSLVYNQENLQKYTPFLLETGESVFKRYQSVNTKINFSEYAETFSFTTNLYAFTGKKITPEQALKFHHFFIKLTKEYFNFKNVFIALALNRKKRINALSRKFHNEFKNLLKEIGVMHKLKPNEPRSYLHDLYPVAKIDALMNQKFAELCETLPESAKGALQQFRRLGIDINYATTIEIFEHFYETYEVSEKEFPTPLLEELKTAIANRTPELQAYRDSLDESMAPKNVDDFLDTICPTFMFALSASLANPSATFQNLLAYLDVNPEYRKQLNDTLKKYVTPDVQGHIDLSKLTWENILEIEKTTNLLEETLRISPPTLHLLPRNIARPFKINGIKFNRKDIIIRIPYVAQHRNDLVDKPENFCPHRMQTPNALKSHQAFSVGQHQCPGSLWTIGMIYALLLPIISSSYYPKFFTRNWFGKLVRPKTPKHPPEQTFDTTLHPVIRYGFFEER